MLLELLDEIKTIQFRIDKIVILMNHMNLPIKYTQLHDDFMIQTYETVIYLKN